MVMFVHSAGCSSAPVVPGGPRVRPAWVAARERRPFFHQKDREGLHEPRLAGNDCEQLRSIVLLSHGKKDGKKVKPRRPPNRRMSC
jgi:hypothetical protein